MPRLRTLAPWLLAALALAWVAAPHVSKDSLIAIAAIAALATAVALTLILRRRRAPTPPDAQAQLTTRRRRVLARTLREARRQRPTQVWLGLGLPGHGKTAVLTGVGPLRTLGEPGPPPAIAAHSVLINETTRELVLEHPGVACELGPLRGLRPAAILLVVALPELMTIDPAALAATLRPLLLDVLTTLEIDPPIYLVCNKLDRLAGHAELADDARVPWGCELEHAELRARLLGWSQWLLGQRLARLAAEPGADRRARLFTLGAQFTRACERLASLADVLLAPTATVTPRLRGVWLTAARPTPAPHDPLLVDLAAALHTRLRASESPACEPITTDLTSIFTALRRRAGEATRTPRLRRAAQRRVHLLALAICSLAVALGITARSHANDLHTRLQTLAELAATLTAAEPTPPLLRLRGELDTWPRPTLSLRGLLTPELHEALVTAYRRAARERLLRPIWRDLEAALAGDASHDQLRAYLLLTHEHVPGDMSHEPDPEDPAQSEWLRAELPRLADAADLGLLLATLQAHASADDLRFPRDHARVEQTRARLRALDDDEAVVRAALVAADAACEPLTLPAISHAELLTSAAELPCSFTAPGWRLVHAQLLRAAEHRDGWVLARPTRERADPARLARLRGRYDALHIAAWTDFLASVRVHRPTDLAAAARLLAELTGDDRPLTQLFTALAHHTRDLQRPQPRSVTDLLIDSTDLTARTAAISRAFAPLLAFAISPPDRQAGLDRYHARLVGLRDALEAARRDPAELPALQTELTRTLADTHALLQTTDLRRFRPLLSDLLLPPLTAIQSLLRDEDKLALTSAYCREIATPLRRITSRYPFNKISTTADLDLAEFTALFHPETGDLRRFRDARLAPLVTVLGHEVTAKPTARSDEHPLAPAALELFTRAAELGALAFTAGELGLDLEFDLHCNADIGRVTLTVDGATHGYTCGPDHRARMRWPGPGKPAGAVLELLGRDGRRETVPGAGPWGLWRLLEKDGLMLPPADTTRARLVFRLDLRASRLGSLDLAVTPPRHGGATLLFGDPDGSSPTLLAPLRARALLDPPTSLFIGLPGCPADMP